MWTFHICLSVCSFFHIYLSITLSFYHNCLSICPSVHFFQIQITINMNFFEFQFILVLHTFIKTGPQQHLYYSDVVRILSIKCPWSPLLLPALTLCSCYRHSLWEMQIYVALRLIIISVHTCWTVSFYQSPLPSLSPLPCLFLMPPYFIHIFGEFVWMCPCHTLLYMVSPRVDPFC